MATKLDLIEVDERASISATVHGDAARQVLEKLLIGVHNLVIVNPEIEPTSSYPIYEVQIYVDLVTTPSTRRKHSRRNPSVRLPSKIVMTIEE